MEIHEKTIKNRVKSSAKRSWSLVLPECPHTANHLMKHKTEPEK